MTDGASDNNNNNVPDQFKHLLLFWNDILHLMSSKPQALASIGPMRAFVANSKKVTTELVEMNEDLSSLYGYMGEYYSNLADTWATAQKKVNSKAPSVPHDVEHADALKRIWIDIFDNDFTDLFDSPKFGENYGKLVSKELDIVKRWNNIANIVLQSVNLPSKKEIDEVYREIHSLKKRLRIYELELQRLRRTRASHLTIPDTKSGPGSADSSNDTSAGITPDSSLQMPTPKQQPHNVSALRDADPKSDPDSGMQHVGPATAGGANGLHGGQLAQQTGLENKTTRSQKYDAARNLLPKPATGMQHDSVRAPDPPPAQTGTGAGMVISHTGDNTHVAKTPNAPAGRRRRRRRPKKRASGHDLPGASIHTHEHTSDTTAATSDSQQGPEKKTLQNPRPAQNAQKLGPSPARQPAKKRRRRPKRRAHAHDTRTDAHNRHIAPQKHNVSHSGSQKNTARKTAGEPAPVGADAQNAHGLPNTDMPSKRRRRAGRAGHMQNKKDDNGVD